MPQRGPNRMLCYFGGVRQSCEQTKGSWGGISTYCRPYVRGEKRHDTALQSRTGTGPARGKVPSDAPARQVGAPGKLGKTESTPPHALKQERKTFRHATWARLVATTSDVTPTEATQKRRWPGPLAVLWRGHLISPSPAVSLRAGQAGENV